VLVTALPVAVTVLKPPSQLTRSDTHWQRERSLAGLTPSESIFTGNLKFKTRLSLTL